MEINLTLNGVRNLPVDINEEALALLENPNAEFEITLVVSPSGAEVKYPQGEENKKTIRKVKALYVSNIIVHK